MSRRSRAMTPEQKAARQQARDAQYAAEREAWIERQLAGRPPATQQQIAETRRILRLDQPRPAAHRTA